MRATSQQIGSATGGVMLIGMGFLFFTGSWWPGMLFVIGLTAITEGLLEGRGWYGIQGGLVAIGIGVWAIFHYNIAMLFVVLGLCSLVSAFIRPPFLAKPYVDNSLE